MKRCTACRRRIWPWARLGWIVGDHGTDWYHPACHPRRRTVSA